MQDIMIKHRSTHPETFKKRHPDAKVVDVTSKGQDPWVRFSPFYPHGNIPVPFSSDTTGSSVEGIWQGLKVFENDDVDISKFSVTTMKGLKRTVRKFGNCLGHRKGVEREELLSYLDARYEIYLPTYLWVLENCLAQELQQLREIASGSKLILLDYEVNTSVDNLKRPLSHAGLIKCYLENRWPKR